MVLQNYQNWIEMASNIIYIVAFGVGFKCPPKIHLNTQCPPPPHLIGLIEPKNHINLSFLVTLTCGGTSSENCTYFDSATSQGTGACKAEICKLNSNICQIRLDFR